MKTYGLIGRKLGHSFSKRYFTFRFKEESRSDCQYINFEIENLGKEIPLLKARKDLYGLNVTIPYKTEILPFLDELSSACASINACNCIKIQNGKWIGHNTDVIGFEQTFMPHVKAFQNKALILGTGGASKAVAYVLEKNGITYQLVSRTANSQHGIVTYEEITKELLENVFIVINTTPLGMSPDVNYYPPLPYESFTKRHYCYDLIYNPSKSLFLAMAEEQGSFIENGEQMLVLQAEESWSIWNN